MPYIKNNYNHVSGNRKLSQITATCRFKVLDQTQLTNEE